METPKLIYVVTRWSSVSQCNVIQAVYKTFDLAQKDMISAVQNDVRVFRKSGFNYPLVSSTVDVDREESYYHCVYKHSTKREVKDIELKYTISCHSVLDKSFYFEFIFND